MWVGVRFQHLERRRGDHRHQPYEQGYFEQIVRKTNEVKHSLKCVIH